MQKKKNARAIASLVVSIASVLCCIQWYISLALAVVGIVFGILAYRDERFVQKDMAIAGIIVGAVGLALAVCVAIIYIIMYSYVAEQGISAVNGITMFM